MNTPLHPTFYRKKNIAKSEQSSHTPGGKPQHLNHVFSKIMFSVIDLVILNMHIKIEVSNS